MGRTIHYKILAAEQLPPETWAKIETMQAAMNERFIWTCENLKLRPTNEEERKRYLLVPDAPHDAPTQGWGFTKTRDDELNSVFVLKFLQWLSGLVPHVQLRILDEGDLLGIGEVFLEAGVMRIDDTWVTRQRRYLKRSDQPEEVHRLDEAVALAKRHGLLFLGPAAAGYARRAEVAALGISPRELEQLSLVGVVDRMKFPWQEDEHRAAV